jgi:hypothetical protein
MTKAAKKEKTVYLVSYSCRCGWRGTDALSIQRPLGQRFTTVPVCPDCWERDKRHVEVKRHAEKTTPYQAYVKRRRPGDMRREIAEGAARLHAQNAKAIEETFENVGLFMGRVTDVRWYHRSLGKLAPEALSAPTTDRKKKEQDDDEEDED